MNKDGPFAKVLAAATVIGVAVVYLMQWFGYGTLAVGIAAFGAAIAVYVIGGILFFPD